MSCVMRSEFVDFWGHKRAFRSFDYWELSNFFFNVFPETNVVLFPYYKRQVNGQSLRQNIFSDVKRLGPLLIDFV